MVEFWGSKIPLTPFVCVNSLLLIVNGFRVNLSYRLFNLARGSSGSWVFLSSNRGGDLSDGWEIDPFKSRAGRSGDITSSAGLLDIPVESSSSSTTRFGEGRSTSSYSAADTTAPASSEPPPMSEEMRLKLQNAKSISSADFDFDEQGSNFDSARFEGRTSLSSDEYFGRPQPRYQPDYTTELSSIKEGVRESVTKVATRLSAFANDLMSQLQVMRALPLYRATAPYVSNIECFTFSG